MSRFHAVAILILVLVMLLFPGRSQSQEMEEELTPAAERAEWRRETRELRAAAALIEAPVRRALAAGRAAWSRGDAVEAQALLARAAAEFPIDGRALAELGWLQVRQHRFHEAWRTLYAALERPANLNPQAWVRQRASALHSMGVALESIDPRRAMVAYLTSLSLRRSARTARRAARLDSRYQLAHPTNTPLGAREILHVHRHENAEWSVHAPCEQYSADFVCSEESTWRAGDVSFYQFHVRGTVGYPSYDEFWVRRGDQWRALFSLDASALSGHGNTEVVYEALRVRTTPDAWLSVDAQLIAYEQHYGCTWRHAIPEHLACRVSALGDPECIRVNRLRQVDFEDKALGIECPDDLHHHARPVPDYSVQWRGAQMRVRGQAVPPGLGRWMTLDEALAIALDVSSEPTLEPAMKPGPDTNTIVEVASDAALLEPPQ